MLAQFFSQQSCLSALALGVFGSFRWVSKMRETKNIMEYEIELRGALLTKKNLISKLTITWWEKNGQNDLKVSSSFHQSRSKLSFLSLLLYHKIKSHQIRYRNKKVKLYFVHKLHLFLSDTIMIWNLNVFSEIHFDIVKRNFWRFSFWTIAISGNGRKVSFDIYCRFSGFPLGRVIRLSFYVS